MKVIVVGGGKVGHRLASLLRSSQHEVKIIDASTAVAGALQQELGSGAVIHGNGSEPSVLEAAGARTADVIAAVTGQDEVNLVVLSLARFEFHVSRTIARVNDPRNAWMYTDVMGVDVAVNQADLIAHLIIQEMTLGDMFTPAKIDSSAGS